MIQKMSMVPGLWRMPNGNLVTKLRNASNEVIYKETNYRNSPGEADGYGMEKFHTCLPQGVSPVYYREISEVSE